MLQHVNVFVEAPAECRNLSKTGLRSGLVKVMGVGWDTAVLFCTNALCGNITRRAPSPAADAAKEE